MSAPGGPLSFDSVMKPSAGATASKGGRRDRRSSAPKPLAPSGGATIEHISRRLSYFLRHGAAEAGIPMAADGFAFLDDIFKQSQMRNVTVEDVREVVRACPKQRFALDETGPRIRIRANQGHSFAVAELELKTITLENFTEICPVVYHGTSKGTWDKILESGHLHRMAREHIHMTVPQGISGARASAGIFIYIDLAKALTDGVPFFQSANGVILSPGVVGTEGILPSKYFAKVTNRAGEVIWTPAQEG
ncbi:hypothetical protein H696_03804 [Fonticula alba]|uniref:2'-phosphotransferase n=1 Tax=Fonticula alba TaxID=691883 RepID=A0A058Z5H2_FONAL|nr:hypothetical protein H696_03804 [Fonticula alba]KCV69371.1 hypothetical protein H696_03804 [Fonticula alba]|eukprot:XP_009495936.1 hypothetical protein H696_03804 [Fonticula alba]